MVQPVSTPLFFTTLYPGLFCSTRRRSQITISLNNKDAKHESFQMYYNPFNKFDIATTTILFLIKNATKLFFKNRWPSIFHEATIVFRMNFSWLSLSFEYSLRFHDLVYLRQQLFFDKLFMTLSLFLFFEILWFSTLVQQLFFNRLF